MSKLSWLIKMAWRDSRKNRLRLFLFTSSIIMGIAALVAINSFGENLRNDVGDQAKELLGSDMRIETRREITPLALETIQSMPGEQSIESNFSSMVLFPKTKQTRLVQIKAMSGGYPFYGKLKTTPEQAGKTFQENQGAIVDKALLNQFKSVVGDSVKVGQVMLPIVGQLNSIPGRATVASSVAPIVLIPRSLMDATGLVQKGSRVSTRYHFKLPPDLNADDLIAANRKLFRKEKIRATSVQSNRENTGEAFKNMNSFLNLVAFIALLLGCIGVASAVHIYIKGKIETVAVLRCLGVQGRDAFMIYLIQIFVMGIIGSVLGAAIGSIIQTTFPAIWSEFLPVEANFEISWDSIIQGICIGLVISVLFALLPLLAIRKVSPLNTLRKAENTKQEFDIWRYLVLVLIALFIVGFAWWQIRALKEAVAFTLFIGFAFLVLTIMGKLLMIMVRKFFPTSWSYLWRQSLANLYRPNNQTLILLVSIGLGTMLISFLYFTQSMLLDQLRFSDKESQPNMILFDIQDAQKEKLKVITSDFQIPVLQDVPIVTMRLTELNGRTREAIENDSTVNLPRWAFNRENRVTFRDSLIDSESITKGKWEGKYTDQSTAVPVSLESGYAEAMKVGLGDEMVFNVQGLPVKTVVTSLRGVSWNRIQTNFMIVFPTGVLEEAPKFHVLVSRTTPETDIDGFKHAVVSEFPNVSVLDLTQILSMVNDILGKVSFVISFMALFSIITGLLVLIGSVIISKYQRIRESVLLRTLGAKRNQILIITALEYAFLGALAALTGILLAMIGSYVSSYFLFQMTFVPPLKPVLSIFFGITLLTVFVGLSNVRGVLGQSPLAVLRGA